MVTIIKNCLISIDAIRKTLFLIVVLFSFGSFSQDTNSVFIETNASFVGGQEALNNFIHENIMYPTKAKKNGIEGIVHLLFIVETDGTISNITIESGPKELTNEAIRVLNSMPKWTPSMMGNTAVREKVRLPIEFIL